MYDIKEDVVSVLEHPGRRNTYIGIHRGLRELRGMAQLLHLVARFDNDGFLAQEGFVVSLMSLLWIGLSSATDPSSFASSLYPIQSRGGLTKS